VQRKKKSQSIRQYEKKTSQQQPNLDSQKKKTLDIPVANLLVYLAAAADLTMNEISALLATATVLPLPTFSPFT
jgi:hypothetical protein